MQTVLYIILITNKVAPWPRWLVSGLSLWRFKFNPCQTMWDLWWKM